MVDNYHNLYIWDELKFKALMRLEGPEGVDFLKVSDSINLEKIHK